MPTRDDPKKVVILSPRHHALVKAIAKRRNLSHTELVRRAVLLWDFVETEQAKGHRLLLMDPCNGKKTVRELRLFF